MAMKPNYNFEKRQRELAKKKQKDEKRLKKLARNDAGATGGVASPSTSDGSTNRQ